MKNKYYHDEESHNLDAPNEMVPEIHRIFQPASVVDFGCGIGTFLYAFKKLGVEEVLGLDGFWVDRNLLKKYIDVEEFKEVDLEKKVDLGRKYDMAICLEVAEHLKESAADTIVENLVNSGKIILFGAAIPGQGGQNHLNEQWIPYWEKKFNDHGYYIHDIIRTLFWDNPNVNYWYKQNSFIFAPKEYELKTDVLPMPVRKIVHYELYNQKVENILEITTGAKPLKNYLKWIAFCIFGRKNIQSLWNFIKFRGRKS